MKRAGNACICATTSDEFPWIPLSRFASLSSFRVYVNTSMIISIQSIVREIHLCNELRHDSSPDIASVGERVSIVRCCKPHSFIIYVVDIV